MEEALNADEEARSAVCVRETEAVNGNHRGASAEREADEAKVRRKHQHRERQGKLASTLPRSGPLASLFGFVRLCSGIPQGLAGRREVGRQAQLGDAIPLAPTAALGKIPISCIALDPPEDDENNLLVRIARETGGRFYHCRTQRILDAKKKELAARKIALSQ